MAISKTSIINKALTLCGAAPITNIDDDTNNARIANRVYEIARRSILSECDWTFASTRCTLSVSTKEMPWDFDDEAYVYVRPTTVIRIFAVSEASAVWREEGNYIISDTSGLGIKYVFDNDNPETYSASFTDAFVDKLCADICFAIINSGSKAKDFLEKYERVSLPKAKAENAQTGTHQVPRDDEWISAKSGSGRPDRSYY